MFTTTTTFVVYIFAMIVIGIVAARSTSSLNDYVLGGRRLGRVITGLSAGASDMSGWLLMGLPGALYVAGISQAWIAIGLTIGQWCNWKFVAARLRSFTQNASDALTLPDYFVNLVFWYSILRCGDKIRPKHILLVQEFTQLVI